MGIMAFQIKALQYWPFCAENPLLTSSFQASRASYAENINSEIAYHIGLSQSLTCKKR